MLESPLSSRKLARMAALSFWTTARSSAMVLEALTLRINCLTACLLALQGENGRHYPREAMVIEITRSACVLATCR